MALNEALRKIRRSASFGMLKRSSSLSSLKLKRSQSTSSSFTSRADKRTNSTRSMDGHDDSIGTSNHITEKKEMYLLDRLGGMMALQTILHDFVSRVGSDDELAVFFHQDDNASKNFKILAAHQQVFFVMAFTEMPTDTDAMECLILRRHRHFFAQGLNEKHFDRVVQHLIDALEARNFQSVIINEVIDVVAPTRDVFKAGAAEAAMRERELVEHPSFCSRAA